MSFKVEVKVNSDPWVANGLRFATEKEGNEYGNDLLSRWFLPSAFRVVPSDDPVNYSFIDGKLIGITQ